MASIDWNTENIGGHGRSRESQSWARSAPAGPAHVEDTPATINDGISGFGVPGRPAALVLRADLRVELLLLVFGFLLGFLLFVLWRRWLLRRRRSRVLRLRLRVNRRQIGRAH